MLNPFFLNGSQSEQSLVQSLVNEQLRMYGIEVYYLPRRYLKTNSVIREVIQSEFKDAYPIEAYLDNYEGFTGQGSILSKFGIENRDDLQLIISKERFEDYISPLLANVPNSKLSTRPKEGDLIYFPLGDRLFEIKFVEHEQPFYQLKKTYVYELRCELFRYEDEVLDTNVEDIDDEIAQIGYMQTLSLIGAGTTATAEATVCANGAVSQIYIGNMGRNYSSTPTVGFSSAPTGGVTAEGVAAVSYEYPGCKGQSGVVTSIYITNAGCGYITPPWITLSGGGGSGFAATTGISTNGSIMYITVTDGGSGYVMAPAVSIGQSAGVFPTFDNTTYSFDTNQYTWDSEYPSASRDAVAISTISTSGIVTDVYVIDGGEGYGAAPKVLITPPMSFSEANIGEGTFKFNEIVIGQTSNTTARVKEWNAVTNIMEVSIVDGYFVRGEVLVGSESGARYVIGSTVTDDLVTPYAQNDVIESEADKIVDFSSANPFGMP